MYKKEIDLLKKSNRFRQREIYPKNIVDLASNDYLGLSEKRSLFMKACKRVLKYPYHSSKASLLVNGYHPIHKEFEEYISFLNGFERAIVAGSGFLANIALIESLPRRKDLLILDEKFHASGILASKLASNTVFFKHNDPLDLDRILKSFDFQRAIVAVEGVYSMDGDIVNREIFKVCDRKDTILIVDEAHSAGVLGDSFLGVFEHFNIKPKKNHIKMGTLGKALGSYGAYILCSKEIEDFLLNRAKTLIYATAVSPFDIALAHEGMRYIQANKKKLKKKREEHIELFRKNLDIKMDALIAIIEIGNSKKVMELKEFFLKKGFLIGAIRPPTVDRALLRIIPRLNVKKDILKEFLEILKRKI